MYTFPKSARLLKSHEYRKVCLEGQVFSGKYIIFHFKEQPLCIKNKLGISVSRQYGKSHVRNKFKRYIREIFRHETKHSSLTIHIKPRPLAREATLRQLSDEYHYFMAKAIKNVALKEEMK